MFNIVNNACIFHPVPPLDKDLLDEESFMNALKDGPGRSTNISIFDELRVSFGNMTRFDYNLDRTNEEHIAHEGTQTDEYALCADNNNVDIPCGECQVVCPDCAKLKDYTAKLETDIDRLESNKKLMLPELTGCEDNLQLLQNAMTEGNASNDKLQKVVATLEAKLLIIEAANESQRLKIESLVRDTSCAECQTDSGMLCFIFFSLFSVLCFL